MLCTNRKGLEGGGRTGMPLPSVMPQSLRFLHDGMPRNYRLMLFPQNSAMWIPSVMAERAAESERAVVIRVAMCR
jgi:hypothetical protein